MRWSKTLKDRFFEKVSVSGLDDCWMWMASAGNSGYGHIGIGGKTVDAHVISYELHFGTVPNGMDVRHTCDNKLCVNPRHLILGTRSDNMMDFYDRNYPKKGNLSERDVRNIVSLCKQNMMSQKEIGEIFGIPQQRVSKILNGKTYKRVVR